MWGEQFEFFSCQNVLLFDVTFITSSLCDKYGVQIYVPAWCRPFKWYNILQRFLKFVQAFAALRGQTREMILFSVALLLSHSLSIRCAERTTGNWPILHGFMRVTEYRQSSGWLKMGLLSTWCCMTLLYFVLCFLYSLINCIKRMLLIRSNSSALANVKFFGKLRQTIEYILRHIWW